MSEFTLHTPDSAPEPARAILRDVQKKLGFVPNMYANLANAPATLEAYLGLSAQFDKTSFTPVERQVVILAVSVENGCEFCVAAHSLIARKMVKAPDAVVDALRNRTPLPDARLQALAVFARTMVKERGWVTGAPLEAFLKAGFTHQQALEVVLGVTMKTLSNYSNHLMGTTTNAEFSSEAWKRPA
ncbi:MAG: carboxymuconolactone decarboxylase family protein [Rhodanobacteraceae bacterium]|nr:MAG: carboxymuconolactone decarboxylase family protein [Rhodanobacteraceae bacterium]